MVDRVESGGGLTVLDGVALVTGSAVASVHLRDVFNQASAEGSWVLLWGTFAWISLTSAGPFMLLVRWFGRRPPGYPGVGDWLWGLLGLPWMSTALIRAVASSGEVPHQSTLYATGLGASLALAALIAVAVVWATWVMVPPEKASKTAAAPWTNRVGLILAVAWPLQCGVGLVVVG